MYGVTILTSHPVSLWQVFITGHFLSIAPVVRSFDNAIHPIPVYSAVRFVITYPLDRNLSVGRRYPPFISWALSSIFSPPLPPPFPRRKDRRPKRKTVRTTGEKRLAPCLRFPSLLLQHATHVRVRKKSQARTK